MTVSILVPFRDEPGTPRLANWKWLKRRWRAVMPDAEIVVGTDTGMPFSKTVAVNDAYSKASGDVFVIADADSWCEIDPIQRGIAYTLEHGVLVIPWVNAYRLTEKHSAEILKMKASTPNPVTDEMKKGVEDYRPSPSTAAMVIIVTREGFERVGGMDPGFRGWGVEDVAFGIACSTMLGRSKIMLAESFALFHPRPRLRRRRVWENDDGRANDTLGMRYRAAEGHVSAMFALCSAHPLPGAKMPVGAGPGATARPANIVVREFQERAYGGTMDGDRILL